jgi:hypothetical protein
LLADQEDPAAQFQYACISRDGKGVEIDMKEIAEYFKLSADQGIPMVRTVPIVASNSAKAFPLIFQKPHSISNCPPIKGIPIIS